MAENERDVLQTTLPRPPTSVTFKVDSLPSSTPPRTCHVPLSNPAQTQQHNCSTDHDSSINTDSTAMAATAATVAAAQARDETRSRAAGILFFSFPLLH
jgi:hypothetical protein